jgi:hypothetical protein
MEDIKHEQIMLNKYCDIIYSWNCSGNEPMTNNYICPKKKNT